MLRIIGIRISLSDAIWRTPAEGAGIGMRIGLGLRSCTIAGMVTVIVTMDKAARLDVVGRVLRRSENKASRS